MRLEKIEQINKMWFDTDVYKWIFAKGENNLLLAEDIEKSVSQKYDTGTIFHDVPIMAIKYECELIAKQLAPFFTSWEEYIDYIKTLNDFVVEGLYKTDAFDTTISRLLECES